MEYCYETLIMWMKYALTAHAQYRLHIHRAPPSPILHKTQPDSFQILMVQPSNVKSASSADLTSRMLITSYREHQLN